ncbi:MAG: OmpH family outer membrane protein [Candidatus Omnitrophota bacterium]
MKNFCKKMGGGLITVLVLAGMIAGKAYAVEAKIGYVDLRKAFYEYTKTKELEKSLNDLTEQKQAQRTEMAQNITKMRGEMELLSGDAKAKKQGEVDTLLVDLQELDRSTRQELLNRKNDMFREVVDDIQKIVEDIGKKKGYDYILDSRNVMYAKEEYDLTAEVITGLNGKQP